MADADGVSIVVHEVKILSRRRTLISKLVTQPSAPLVMINAPIATIPPSLIRLLILATVAYEYARERRKNWVWS